MKLFAFPRFDAMAHDLACSRASVERGGFLTSRFANGELVIDLLDSVKGVECAVLGTVAPPDQNLVEYLLLCDTLAREGASRVIALLPYLAYQRQDHPEPGRSLAASWLGHLLMASGVNEIFTLDIHSLHACEVFPIRLESLPVASLFVSALGDRLRDDITIVAPDEGAQDRCQALIKRSGLGLRFAHFEKRRTPEGVTSRLIGEVTNRVLIVDDILDTGETLIACAEGLRTAGAREISIAVTHGLFTGTDWRRLWDLGIEEIVCTDSVGDIKTSGPRVRVMSCAGALEPGLAGMARPAGQGAWAVD